MYEQVEKLTEEKDALEKQLVMANENLSHLENQNIESGIISANYKVSDSLIKKRIPVTWKMDDHINLFITGFFFLFFQC